MLDKLLDRIFTEDETLGPRTVVAAGLMAYAPMLAQPVLGTVFYFLAPLMLAGVALLCFAAIRELAPMLDPEDRTADRPLVYAAGVLFLLIGLQSFGFWFLPGLAGGVGLVALRAPELREVLPGQRRLSTYTFEREGRD